MKFRSKDYENDLIKKELSTKTICKYLCDVKKYYDFCVCEKIDNDSFDSIVRYKEFLKKNYKSTSVNSYLISLNRYLKWLERDDLCVSLIRCQRKYFTPAELTLSDYRAMLKFAEKSGQTKWYLIMRCLGSMGIRVGELKFITYEAVLSGNAEIFFKSKLRTILIPAGLQGELLYFCQGCGTEAGTVFMNKSGTAPID
ncbi:MAG: site-specific integrase, partial [Oscillospiraceae bacterium]|nr:site-specific integrase [Oscillospiraceae bacterium]